MIEPIKREVGFSLTRENITVTLTDIPLTFNTHNTERQIVKVHINKLKVHHSS